MKDYMKPEVEVIDFAAEVIMTDDMGGSVEDVSQPEIPDRG